MMQRQRILSMTVSSSLTPAVAGYDRPTSTRVVFHGPIHGGEFRRQRRQLKSFCSSDIAAHSDFLLLCSFKYSYSLTHSHEFILIAISVPKIFTAGSRNFDKVLTINFSQFFFRHCVYMRCRGAKFCTQHGRRDT